MFMRYMFRPHRAIFRQYTSFKESTALCTLSIVLKICSIEIYICLTVQQFLLTIDGRRLQVILQCNRMLKYKIKKLLLNSQILSCIITVDQDTIFQILTLHSCTQFPNNSTWKGKYSWCRQHCNKTHTIYEPSIQSFVHALEVKLWFLIPLRGGCYFHHHLKISSQAQKDVKPAINY
jgi:hypothetical protein